MALTTRSLATFTGRGNGLYAAKPRFQRLLAGCADRLAAHGVHPDSVTYAAVGCAALGGAALSLGSSAPWVVWAIPPLAAARLALNALDGMVAQRRQMGRPWGKVLNEFCDRLADLAFLTPLLLVPGANTRLALAALLAVLLVSYLGVLAEAAGTARQYGGVMGKADRMLWLGLAAILTAATGNWLPLQALPGVLLAGSLATLIQRGARIHAALLIQRGGPIHVAR